MDVGGGDTEGPRPLGEVLAGRGGPQRDPPGIVDAVQELLRERERAGCGRVSGGIRPLAVDVSDRARHIR